MKIFTLWWCLMNPLTPIYVLDETPPYKAEVKLLSVYEKEQEIKTLQAEIERLHRVITAQEAQIQAKAASAYKEPTTKEKPQNNANTSELYTITFYTNYEESTGKTESHPDFGVTASGKRTQDGVTAACPKEIPFGTVLSIEGFGERVCWDRGGGVKGNHIDIYVPTIEQAVQLGRQTRQVTILQQE